MPLEARQGWEIRMKREREQKIFKAEGGRARVLGYTQRELAVLFPSRWLFQRREATQHSITRFHRLGRTLAPFAVGRWKIGCARCPRGKRPRVDCNEVREVRMYIRADTPLWAGLAISFPFVSLYFHFIALMLRQFSPMVVGVVSPFDPWRLLRGSGDSDTKAV